MGRIQSSVGLISGIPIKDTVDQLMSISARPRELLQSRTDAMGREQAAFTELTALSVSLQLSINYLGREATYDKRDITVSASDKLTAVAVGTPPPGVYTLTPDRTAQSHHLLGAGVASRTAALGAGALTLTIGDGDQQSITITADDTLDSLVKKINDAKIGVAATIVSDGSSEPFRLSLVSNTSGAAGEITIDEAPPGITFTEVAEARDARLWLGTPDTGVAITSSTNTFKDVLPGVTLTIKGASTDPITVSIEQSDSGVVTQAKLFVEQYNKLIEKLSSYASFDEQSQSTGMLFGSLEVVRIQSDLTNEVTRRHFGLGSIQTMAELGFEVGEGGKITLNEAKLKERYAAGPQEVREFFSRETTGVSARFNASLERIAGRGNSLLLNRIASLGRKIEGNKERIAFMDDRLERQRERLLNQFYMLDSLVAKMQQTTSYISRINQLAEPVSNNRR